ncbi:V-type ATP synthase subunit C [Thermococcus cleftensis]|uniref:A-type ATP synthase subunit C n=1 Tax=Thermococcus cleftensis (strain DSM 27260 / KACC 17922 / CL1) TaxID=163003 RepID=I3ZTV2_THECF|nr:V-type ATP synthase subunit C [Thermococcus cleftensis]AFL95136.1 V-type ATP synthase subunit C [Thermococcus cleftensis]
MEPGAVSGILNTTLAVVFTWVGYKTAKIVWKYTPYSYPNARIKAMEAKLLTEQRFNELAESRTLQNFVVSLEDTDYRDYFADLSSYDIESIERALERALAGTYELMVKILPKRSAPFFRLMLEEWDVRNIASVVKAKLAGEPASDYVVELGTMLPKVKAMAEAKTMEEILVILEGTPYEEPYQKLLLGEMSLREFETELYKMHYAKLLNYALSRKEDERVILEEFVRLRIDKLNLLTVLRAKSAGMAAEEIKPMLIPGGSVKLDPLLHVDDLGMALAELDSTKYGKVIRDVREEVERDLGVLERTLERHIVERLSELNRFYPLSVATPLGYVLQKEREIRKLRAIAKLISDGLEPERIKEMAGDAA